MISESSPSTQTCLSYEEMINYKIVRLGMVPWQALHDGCMAIASALGVRKGARTMGQSKLSSVFGNIRESWSLIQKDGLYAW